VINFFIAGVQKGGTTALDQYLRAHPQIQMATKKELHYFDDDNLDWDQPDYSKLESFFDWSIPNVVRGEATPIYIYWPSALERICRYSADTKFIVGLRHPSYRAFSHWRMERARGVEQLSFDEAVSWPARDRVRSAPQGAHRVASYVERGLYAAQVARLLAIFPRRQVFFYRTDALWHDRARVLREVHAFLNVDAIAVPERSYIAPVQSNQPNLLPMEIKRKLDRTFADDIGKVESLTGLDLADWLNPSYQELIG
jgi:hypothetical protein